MMLDMTATKVLRTCGTCRSHTYNTLISLISAVIVAYLTVSVPSHTTGHLSAYILAHLKSHHWPIKSHIR
jgi:hypothetical protein